MGQNLTDTDLHPPYRPFTAQQNGEVCLLLNNLLDKWYKNFQTLTISSDLPSFDAIPRIPTFFLENLDLKI